MSSPSAALAYAREQFEIALERYREADHDLQERAVRYAALRARQADPTATHLVLDVGDSMATGGQMTLVDLVDETGRAVLVSDDVTDDLCAAATALHVDGHWTWYDEPPESVPTLGRRWISISQVLGTPPLTGQL